jgi:hypothetical protein
MTSTDTKLADASTKIADLNDTFRCCPGPDWLMTRALEALGPAFAARALHEVVNFSAFTPDNDPHGEHDFGAFEIGSERVFWKIDYYDRELTDGSRDPSDPSLTRRVLTVMLASDY